MQSRNSKSVASAPQSALAADPQSRYIFVTNEASAEALRPHEGAHLFDFPEVDELPPQKLGIKEVDLGIWLVSFMHYDLGYFDLEQKTLQPLNNPVRLSPMS